MELNFVIHRFASKKVWLLWWDQASLFLGSESKRIIPFRFPVLLPLTCSTPLLLAALSSGRASDWSATCRHYRRPLICAGWAFPSSAWLLFLVWVLYLGSGNSESCLWPPPKLPGHMRTPLDPVPQPNKFSTCNEWTSVWTLPMTVALWFPEGNQSSANQLQRMGIILTPCSLGKYPLVYDLAAQDFILKP